MWLSQQKKNKKKSNWHKFSIFLFLYTPRPPPSSRRCPCVLKYFACQGQIFSCITWLEFIAGSPTLKLHCAPPCYSKWFILWILFYKCHLIAICYEHASYFPSNLHGCCACIGASSLRLSRKKKEKALKAAFSYPVIHKGFASACFDLADFIYLFFLMLDALKYLFLRLTKSRHRNNLVHWGCCSDMLQQAVSC